MVQAVKLTAQRTQDLVRQLTDLTQRMIRWHSLLQAHIAEYLVLHSFVSTHLSTDAQTLKKDLNTETFFNKFLGGMHSIGEIASTSDHRELLALVEALSEICVKIKSCCCCP